MNKETLRMQMLAGIITESQYKSRLNEDIDNQYEIGKYKDEALATFEEFITEFEDQGLFEFIPDLENYNIDPSTNSLNIEELGSIYLIPNEGPIPSEVEDFTMDSSDGEMNENGATWKKYPKDGYYYIVMC